MSLTHVTSHLMLTIDQISHLTGVRKSTLRYWEKSFHHCLKPCRTPSNRREYSLEDLERIKTIKRLIEQEHLTSHGVRLRLAELFPSKSEGDRTRQVKGGGVGSRPSF
jgi:DNA-binding transcriptional MerR regulator